MVISEKWSSYKEDNIGKAEFVTENILSKNWWQKIDYILAFTNPIYDVLRSTDMDAPTLHLVHEMWDSMMKKGKVLYISMKEKMNKSHRPSTMLCTQYWFKAGQKAAHLFI
ncbi:hypothetical protein S83_050920, partial [Arachis hypogaea]